MIKKVFDFISKKVSIESSRHLVRLIHSHLKKNTAIANSKGNAGNVCKTHAHGLHVGVGILEICPEMHALAKMAEMAINRQNINKNSNEMAKGPFGKW